MARYCHKCGLWVGCAGQCNSNILSRRAETVRQSPTATQAPLAWSRLAVNITVSIIDGVSGHPAEGVEVSVVGRPDGELSRSLHGLTDPQGNFTYSPRTGRPSSSGL